jgi:hypothetical protein
MTTSPNALTSFVAFFDRFEVFIYLFISLTILGVGIFYLTKSGDYKGGIKPKSNVNRAKVPIKMSYKAFGGILIAIGILFLSLTYFSYSDGKKQKWRNTNPSGPVWWVL